MWRFFTNNKTNRYIEVLQDFLRAYNNSYHPSITMSPVKALSKENEVWNNLYETKIARNFYLTLPSNCSMDFHPENTVATYITSLPGRLVLKEPFEVALTEIRYPTTMYIVDSKDCLIIEKVSLKTL
jgi:hypothetical protein